MVYLFLKMTNLIIATFKEEAEALEASQKLNELESIGDVTIYERVIIKKNAFNKIYPQLWEF